MGPLIVPLFLYPNPINGNVIVRFTLDIFTVKFQPLLGVFNSKFAYNFIYLTIYITQKMSYKSKQTKRRTLSLIDSSKNRHTAVLLHSLK